MLGCGHPDRLLAGRLHKLSGISVVTCSICQAGTSSVHRFGLTKRLDLRLSVVAHISYLTRIDRFLKVLNRLLLTAEAGALLVVEPAELLEYFGVVWITLKDAGVRRLGGVVLVQR